MNNRTISVRLDSLLLDPNNYRFRDAEGYKHVPEEKIADDFVQRQAFQRIVRTSNEGIEDLIRSFQANGYIDDGAIQVRPWNNAEDKYVVIEGNRRAATLLYFKKRILDGAQFEKITLETFSHIEVKLTSGMDDKSYKMAMGLQHVSGKRHWTPINQAQLVEDLIYIDNVSEDEVCQSLGLSKQAVHKFLRTLRFISEYKQSDYGDQFRSDKYSFFEEAMKSPAMREWLGWNEGTRECSNRINAERFFRWISIVEDDDKSQEPIIARSLDVRLLAGFIMNEKAVQMMELKHDLQEGIQYSKQGVDSQSQNSINRIESEIRSLLHLQEPVTSADINRLKQIQDDLQELIGSDEINLSVYTSTNVFNEIRQHFSELYIHRFRGLREIKIDRLSRINLFVGPNNCGKTSFLEAVYLLTQLNNIKRYLELEKARSKIAGGIHMDWLINYAAKEFNIEGKFNGVLCSTRFVCFSDNSLQLDKNGYVTTMMADSMVGDADYKSTLDLYNHKQPAMRYNKIVLLCSAAVSSSYRRDMTAIMAAHQRVVEMGVMTEIIGFLRDHIDYRVQDIRLVNDGGTARFVVNTGDLEGGLDLTKYGEGMQRVFEIALFVVSCENGCLMIDEIDSAIHKTLLPDFIALILDLCKRFNVQAFITTHSKECADCFAKAELGQDLKAYRLPRVGSNDAIMSADGTTLKKLLDNFNFDIR